MYIAIYTRADGAYVLVPDHMTPSADAQNGTGPLTFCETINASEHPHPAVWERVNAEIDRHSYAVLQASVAERFLAPHCGGHRARA
jgi:hypothetical protein